ncbi:MAG TPA: PLDc N-terminal domain-containing protein [Acidimicrobiia bacterium]
MLRLSEILLIALYVAPTVWALSEILRIPTDVWAASKQNQALWTVIVLIVPLLGPLLYFFIARPKLHETG